MDWAWHDEQPRYVFATVVDRLEDRETGSEIAVTGIELALVKRWIAPDTDQDSPLHDLGLPLNVMDEEVLTLQRIDHPLNADEKLLRQARDVFQAALSRNFEATIEGAEQLAVENGYLDPNRADARLFQRGPADPFPTRRQRELAVLTPSDNTPTSGTPSGPDLDF